MRDIEDLRARLEVARAELLTALEGVTQEELVRRPPGEVTTNDQRWTLREVLWHIGTVEDWIGRMASQARDGRATEGYAPPRRPAARNTLALLLGWLDQTRSATLRFVQGLTDEELAIEFTTPPGEQRTVGRVLHHLAVHDDQHREHVLVLRELPAVER
jgi:uncharacterized damage-inducible protein DinB